MSSPTKCCACGADKAGEIWSNRKDGWVCLKCMREYHPPKMTLIEFDQGSYRKLWNLEVGMYEDDLVGVEDLEWCGWIVKSKQDAIFSLVPKVRVNVYHMELYGDIICGRCVDYKFFEGSETCLSPACEKAALPFKSESDIQYPPVESRYRKWTRMTHA